MTRRDAVNRLTARLVPLYGEREARAIARNAVAELAGIPLSALLRCLEGDTNIESCELVDINSVHRQ